MYMSSSTSKDSPSQALVLAQQVWVGTCLEVSSTLAAQYGWSVDTVNDTGLMLADGRVDLCGALKNGGSNFSGPSESTNDTAFTIVKSNTIGVRRQSENPRPAGTETVLAIASFLD